jgi:DNA-binding transcriptional MerR regulator/methylmalonyl-CoA mutase cobalamin-binding subunit
MYTIREASARTGVGAPLIRAWERRYGVVTPTRTPAGYRLYDERTLATLRTMRSLIDSGWSASEAARAITGGEVAVESTAPGAVATAVATAVAANQGRLVERFVAAAASTSPIETEAVLDEILASGSFEAIVDDLLLPAAAALGDAWATGRLSVAAEHAASGAIARRLSAVFQAAGAPTRVSVVVGMPPGARHELGALAFAGALRRRGVGVLYIGPDVTVDGWVDAVGRTRARAAVVGVVTPDDRVAAATTIGALRSCGVAIVAVGGAAAGPDLVEGDGILVLPPRVADAARVVVEALGRRR